MNNNNKQIFIVFKIKWYFLFSLFSLVVISIAVRLFCSNKTVEYILMGITIISMWLYKIISIILILLDNGAKN